MGHLRMKLMNKIKKSLSKHPFLYEWAGRLARMFRKRGIALNNFFFYKLTGFMKGPRDDFSTFVQSDEFPVKISIGIVDIGFRFGLCPEWERFKDSVNCIGFELDKDECERLNERIKSAGRHDVVYPYAIGGKSSRTETLYVTQFHPSAGLRKPNETFLKRLNSLERETHKIRRTIPVDTVSLDSAIADDIVNNINYLKIDTEGFDDDILSGAEKLLKSPQLFGVKTEFFCGPFKNPAMLSNIDIALRGNGFHLFDLTAAKYSRRTFDRGYICYDKAPKLLRHAYGQIMSGDVVYLKDPVYEITASPAAKSFVWNDENVAIMCCVFYVHDLFDCAVELLETYQGINPGSKLKIAPMIQRLCPRLPNGKLLSYSDYIKTCNRLYWEEQSFFRSYWMNLNRLEPTNRESISDSSSGRL